jgi:hypothetical protein
MAGPLRNQKHEKFVQFLFEGQPANQAYEAAGYRYHEGNASRLRSSEKVIDRLRELQEAAARNSEMTVESLVAELEAVRQHATSDRQWGSAVKAIAEKIKLSGLLVQRVEVSNILSAIPVDASYADFGAWLARNYQGSGLELTAEQKEAFGQLLSDWADAATTFVDRCRAANAKTVPAISPPTYEIERKRLGLRSNAR